MEEEAKMYEQMAKQKKQAASTTANPASTCMFYPNYNFI